MSKEVLVRCSVCGERLTLLGDDSTPLIQHLQEKHQNLCISSYCPTTPMERCNCAGEPPDTKDPPPRKLSLRSKAEHHPRKRRLHRLAYDKKKYRTTGDGVLTVETWKPGSGTILCPSCGTETQPTVSKQSNKYFNNSLCAMCLVGCWPLFLWPFLWCKQPEVNLYCSNCGHFLGTFDRGRNMARASSASW